MQLLFKGGKSKGLTLSYDDGPVDDIRLVEILNKYGIKGTFNLNSASFFKSGDGKVFGGRMTVEEAKEMYLGSGHEIAVHGLTHPWISALSEPEIVMEVTEDRRRLEEAFGIIVRGMAYPFGCYNDKTVEALKASGIVYSRTTIATNGFRIPDDWLRMPATCHHNNPRLPDMAKEFVETPAHWGVPDLFYLWGHSFEFARNDNWEIIENFCEYMGGRDEIWYATNIEIYDYVKAYESLQVSYDKKIVHNPTASDIWFRENGVDYKISAGETLYL